MNVILALEEEMSVGMAALALLTNVTFVTLHGPGGQEITVNIAEISSIRQRRADSDDHFPKDVKCVLVMTNGNINAVVEPCIEVIKQISKEIEPEAVPQ